MKKRLGKTLTQISLLFGDDGHINSLVGRSFSYILHVEYLFVHLGMWYGSGFFVWYANQVNFLN